MDLDDILNGEDDNTPAPSLEAAPAPAAAPAAAAPEAQPRDPAGRFAPTGEQPNPAPAAAPAAAAPAPATGAPPASQDQPTHVPAAALADERRKRQELEAELARLRAPAPQPAHQHQPQPAAPAQIPSIFDDEEGFAAGILERATQAAMERLAPQFAVSQQTMRVELGRQAMRQANADFDQVEAEWFKLADANPALVHHVSQQANPIEAAYQLTKDYIAKVQAPAAPADAEALRAQIRAEILAEMGHAPTPSPAPAPAPIPTSLAGAPAGGGAAPSPAVPHAPPTLDQILSGA